MLTPKFWAKSPLKINALEVKPTIKAEESPGIVDERNPF